MSLDKLKKKLEILRIKIGCWLIQTNTMSATMREITERVNQTRCVHCGENPYFIEELLEK